MPQTQRTAQWAERTTMNSKTIRVVMCEPGKRACTKEINTDLHSMQEIVGGFIELYYLTEDVFLVCNDEHKINGMQMNRTITNEEGKIVEVICGPFFIAKDDPDGEGEICSLSWEEAEHYRKKYLFPEDIFLVGSQIMAFPYYPEA